jgi:hypothetical protein
MKKSMLKSLVSILPEDIANAPMESAMRFKTLLVIVTVVAVSGCFKFSYTGAPKPVKPQQSDIEMKKSLLKTLVSILPEDIAEAPDPKKISQHPYTRLMAEPACERIASIPFASPYGYRTTLVGIKNRAVSASANALAVTNWSESPGSTFAVGHFFGCASKKYL